MNDWKAMSFENLEVKILHSFIAGKRYRFLLKTGKRYIFQLKIPGKKGVFDQKSWIFPQK